ncbi:hypothetical protein BCR42DRAFT_411609 [Absidia repens]|uniref:Uncharacterized protein n=1 Tax=Absidia repens TaxID=90262 RepID=A0A1X2ILZ0_9FUNG|nr:hypothetical protein BCR42DRAFT_411609 [Absidia repens]
MLYISTPPSSFHPHNKSKNSNSNNIRGIQKAQLINKNLSRRDQLLKMAQYEYSRQLSQYTQAQLHRIPDGCPTVQSPSFTRVSKSG